MGPTTHRLTRARAARREPTREGVHWRYRLHVYVADSGAYSTVGMECSGSEGEEEGEGWGELAAELDLGGDDSSSAADDDDDDEERASADRPGDRMGVAVALDVARRSQLSRGEFDREFRHRKPVLLEGFANGWEALSSWSSVEHLASLLDEDVLVLLSPDDRRFLKRDCDQYRRPFGDVVRELCAQHPPPAPPPPAAAAAAAAGASERPEQARAASGRMYASSSGRSRHRGERGRHRQHSCNLDPDGRYSGDESHR